MPLRNPLIPLVCLLLSAAVHAAASRPADAVQTEARALNEEGTHYYLGKDMPPDYPKAAALFQQAAKLGYAPAQSNLAVMQLEGDGLPPIRQQPPLVSDVPPSRAMPRHN